MGHLETIQKRRPTSPCPRCSCHLHWLSGSRLGRCIRIKIDSQPHPDGHNVLIPWRLLSFILVAKEWHAGSSLGNPDCPSSHVPITRLGRRGGEVRLWPQWRHEAENRRSASSPWLQSAKRQVLRSGRGSGAAGQGSAACGALGRGRPQLREATSAHGRCSCSRHQHMEQGSPRIGNPRPGGRLRPRGPRPRQVRQSAAGAPGMGFGPGCRRRAPSGRMGGAFWAQEAIPGEPRQPPPEPELQLPPASGALTAAVATPDPVLPPRAHQRGPRGRRSGEVGLWAQRRHQAEKHHSTPSLGCRGPSAGGSEHREPVEEEKSARATVK
ncbi:uncharacterized protein LOC117975557 [Pan paniscus]|uniref:uncharacterized protein LOC117975557 n=1 Tax=Pan paniscus TaxID=9597 RepID=UPI003007DDB0